MNPHTSLTGSVGAQNRPVTEGLVHAMRENARRHMHASHAASASALATGI